MEMLTETNAHAESMEPDTAAEQAAPAESLAELLAGHERERSVALARISAERREADRATAEAIRSDAAAGVARVIGALRDRLRAEHGRNDLYAHARHGLPNEARELERIAAEAGPGERPVLVMIPFADAFGSQQRIAHALIDVSDVVWG